MSNKQFKAGDPATEEQFQQIVNGLGANNLITTKLVTLMDLAHDLGAWPEDSAPKLVRQLWK